MNIVIGSESSIATPPAGEATLFINTDKGNMLYAKYPDGSFSPYTASGSAEAQDLANSWMNAISCALKDGIIDADDFESIMNQGLTVQSSTVTDGDGNVTTTLNVGSRPGSLVDITLDSLSYGLSVAGTHQTVTTFNPANTSNKTLTYISSNTGRATVSNTGLVTGTGVGVVTITVIPAADPSKSKVVTVTVS